METPKLDYYLNEKINAIAPKITDSGASTIQLQINNTFSSIASESVSNVLKQSVTDLAGTIDTVNSDLVSMLDKVNDNIAEYQKILDSFNSSVGGTQTLIDNAKKCHICFRRRSNFRCKCTFRCRQRIKGDTNSYRRLHFRIIPVYFKWSKYY